MYKGVLISASAVPLCRTTTKKDEYRRFSHFQLLVEFVYLVVIRMPGESYRRRPRSLLMYLCYVFRAIINSLV